MNLSLLKKKNPFQNPFKRQQPFQQQQGVIPDDDPETDGEDTEDDPVETDPSAEEDTDEPSPVIGPKTNRFQDIFGQISAQPQMPMAQKFTDYLNKPVPTREQYKPNMMGRIGAILGGASEGYFKGAGEGIKTKREAMDRPFNDAMSRYAIEGKNLEQGANIENRNLSQSARLAQIASTSENASIKNEVDRLKAWGQINHWSAIEHQAAKDAAMRGWVSKVNPTDGRLVFSKVGPDGKVQSLDGGKVGESLPEATKRKFEEFSKQQGVLQGDRLKLEGTRQGNRLKLKEVDQENRIATEEEKQKGRLAIAEFKKGNPNFKLVAVKGGNIMGINPSDPNDIIDTGIKTNTLGDKEKLDLGVAGKKELQDNAAVNTRINTNIKAGQERQLILDRQAAAEGTAAATPQAQNADAQLRMKKLYTKYGDKIKDYFNFDQNGNPISLHPGDPDDEDYKGIYQAIYGKKKKKE